MKYPISNYTVATPATEEPVSLEAAKLHLSVDIDEHDDLITALIVAAREHVEAATGRALVSRTIDYYIERFPCSFIELPIPPVVSVTSLIYTDIAGTATTCTVTGSNLLGPTGSVMAHIDLVNIPARIVLAYSQVWPSTVLQTVNAIKIRMVCGYGAAASVPSSAKQAMLLLIGTWYAQRESITGGMERAAVAIPHGVEMLLAPLRVWNFA